ncbi:MAG: hypothetical protein JWM31_1066 [Solirubrobacterales bacterium]|nr:hypothetical protein [Solirubrobacterales bacterium]
MQRSSRRPRCFAITVAVRGLGTVTAAAFARQGAQVAIGLGVTERQQIGS